MNREDQTDRSDLSAFLDGQLPPDEAEQMAKALQADPQLRAELASLETTRHALAALPRERAPEGLHDAVMEHLERQRLLRAPAPPQPVQPLRWIRHLATAAIVMLTVGLGFYLHSVLSERSWVAQQDAEAGLELARRIDQTDRNAPTPTAGDEVVVERVVEDFGRIADQPPSPSGPESTSGRREARYPRMGKSRPQPAKGDTDALAAAPVTNDEAEVPATDDVIARGETVSHPLALADQDMLSRPGKLGEAEAWFAGQTMVAVRTVQLSTTDLAGMNDRVSDLLASNDIRPQVSQRAGGVSFDPVMSRSNSFFNVRTGPDTNQVIFYVTEDQAPKIVAQLEAIDALVAAGDVVGWAGAPLRRDRGKARGGALAQAKPDQPATVSQAMAEGAPLTPAPPESSSVAAAQPADGADGMGMGGMGMGGTGMGGVGGPSTRPQIERLTHDGALTGGREAGHYVYGLAASEPPKQNAYGVTTLPATTGMGRLVQVIVTITETRPQPRTQLGAVATQPAAATSQPATTTAPSVP